MFANDFKKIYIIFIIKEYILNIYLIEKYLEYIYIYFCMFEKYLNLYIFI